MSNKNTLPILSKSELGDDLCKYCLLEKKGAYGVDGGFMAGCEGSRCDDAYENYLQSKDNEVDGE